MVWSELQQNSRLKMLQKEADVAEAAGERSKVLAVKPWRRSGVHSVVGVQWRGTCIKSCTRRKCFFCLMPASFSPFFGESQSTILCRYCLSLKGSF